MSDPLNIPATRHRLYQLAHYLSPAALTVALHMIPTPLAWRRFLENALLWLGTTLCLAGVIFFFAYNWATMNRFAKFGILETGLLAMLLFITWRGLEALSSKAALLGAAVLLGALLAVYGQVYQTGADVFTLFLTWAILIIPWVMLGHFAPLWLLLLVLFNLSFMLYWNQLARPTLGTTPFFLLMFLLNGTALLIWEISFRWPVKWLQDKWLGKILLLTILTVLVIPTWFAILELNFRYDDPHLQILAGILYLATTILALWYYTSQRRDLFSLAIDLGGILIILTTLIGRWLFMLDQIGWLLLAIVVIVEVYWMVKWLLRTAQHWEKADDFTHDN